MTPYVLDTLASARVIPVVEIDDARQAVRLAEALADGGVTVMEITLRTPAALESIRAVRAALPDFVVGAGSVVLPEQVAAVVDLGVHFAVSPGFDAAISEESAHAGLPLLPGVATPSEVLAAVRAGHTALKFFPAEQLGGPGTLRAVSAPFTSLGLSFMPTGGVTLDLAASYLAMPNVFSVGGSWLAPRDAVMAGDFDRIRDSARATTEALRAGAGR